ncbi:Detected protein of unknown function [Hibiscus syriacus]|uniref:Calcineurin-like metallo-phosphoesterase superfamily protein n=1 Tax=Hibiscus syriacus TaxID=106335 RepID=A0A6A2YW34_HIBSY|nr:Detected protein of unknown function [Hibiscus syriacus]
MNELKDQVCSSWFAPVGSASDYPLLSKWVIYGEIACSNSCPGPSDEISPIYSLWATFIGLYVVNYVVERSTGRALTHPVSVEEYEKLNKNQMTRFLRYGSLVFRYAYPKFSRTSADLFKTVFDLLVSVTVFVGRFDMRMMQAAMSRVHEGAEQDDLLYDHLSEKTDLWFDFMADTDDTVLKLPRGELLLIGGDLAYPNPSRFTYERHLFCPFQYSLQPSAWYKPDHIAVNKPELPKGVSELKEYKGPQCFGIPGNHGIYNQHSPSSWGVYIVETQLGCKLIKGSSSKCLGESIN